MKIAGFEKNIKHLEQKAIQKGAAWVIAELLRERCAKLDGKTISSINKILIGKGIATGNEIQERFLVWMEVNESKK